MRSGTYGSSGLRNVVSLLAGAGCFDRRNAAISRDVYPNKKKRGKWMSHPAWQEARTAVKTSDHIAQARDSLLIGNVRIPGGVDVLRFTRSATGSQDLFPRFCKRTRSFRDMGLIAIVATVAPGWEDFCL